jgi:hypothetical protein
MKKYTGPLPLVACAGILLSEFILNIFPDPIGLSRTKILSEVCLINAVIPFIEEGDSKLGSAIMLSKY